MAASPIPDAIRGTRPHWLEDDTHILAFGPFVVERSYFGAGAPQVGILAYEELGPGTPRQLRFSTSDREIRIDLSGPLTADYAVGEAVLRGRTPAGETITVRALRESDRNTLVWTEPDVAVADAVRQAFDWTPTSRA